MVQRRWLLPSSGGSSRPHFGCLAKLPRWGPAGSRFDMPKASARETIYAGRPKLSDLDLDCLEQTRIPVSCPLLTLASHVPGALGS